MNKVSKYVGLDVHEDTIAVAVTDAGRGNSRFHGTIENTETAVSARLGQVRDRSARRLAPRGAVAGGGAHDGSAPSSGLRAELSGTAVAAVGDEHAVRAREVHPRLGHEGGEAPGVAIGDALTRGRVRRTVKIGR